jgi:hypothetical protein
MRTPVTRVDPATEATAGQWSAVGFRAALVGVPVALCFLFAQIGWFWGALGWAGIGMVALVAVMAVVVIGALWRQGAASRHIRRLNETVAALAKTAVIPQDLAEAMWCERQRDQLLEKQRVLDAGGWAPTVAAFQDPAAPFDNSLDHWSPQAEELARWAQRNLPPVYTEDEVEKPIAQTAPGEAAMAETRRMEFRSLYWRKQMMDRYVSAIAAKLEARAEHLRQTIAEAGNPQG